MYRGSPATNAYLEVESFYFLRYEEGLVVEWWDGTNIGEALRTVGAQVPLPTSTHEFGGPSWVSRWAYRIPHLSAASPGTAVEPT